MFMSSRERVGLIEKHRNGINLFSNRSGEHQTPRGGFSFPLNLKTNIAGKLNLIFIIMALEN